MYSKNTYLKHRVSKKNLKATPTQKKNSQWCRRDDITKYCSRDNIINPSQAKLRKTKIAGVSNRPNVELWTQIHTFKKNKTPI